MTCELAILGGPSAVTVKPDLRWPVMGDAEIREASELIRKGELSYYGREGKVKEFEDNFAAYHQNIKYALACDSGTASLHSAFFGCGIGPGDEVIAPSYTFLATVTPILQSNGIPVLADGQPDTGNIDPADIRRRITSRTKAIVVTHMWGHPCEMDEIMAIARDHNLFVIEDCSHAHGATYRGRKVGTIGRVGCFSLQSKKVITGGTGGIMITNDQTIYERATLLGHFRVRSQQCVTSQEYHRYHSTGFGHNYRMHPVAAAMVDIQLRDLDRRIEGRHRNMTYMNKMLAEIPGIIPPITRDYVTRGAWYGYKPLYDEGAMGGLPKDVYIAAVAAEGVKISNPGSRPLHLLPLFQEGAEMLYNFGCPTRCPYSNGSMRKWHQGDLPVVEAFYKKTLSLPVFTEPSFEVIEQYASAFWKVAEHAGELIDSWKAGKIQGAIDED